MYGRVVTTRGSAQRTQARSQPALRPLNHDGNLPDGRVLGGLSREEVRQQQTLKYTEDSRKFAEKQKEKEQKKREERWKRYSHVDVGRRLNSDDQEFETDLEFIRNQQQFTYESQSAEGLEWERERENSRAQRENRRREEKLKKYSHVTAGQQLGSFERTTGSGSEGGKRPRRNQQLQQSNYELQSAVNSEHVQQPSSSRSADVNRLGCQVNDINLNENYDRAMEQKKKLYQGTKLKTETGSSNFTSGSSTPGMFQNNLNATCETEDEMSATISQVDREREHRERMRLARERLQNKYNEELQKSL